MGANISTAQNIRQQHHANRLKISALLPFGMDRTQLRQARRRTAFKAIKERFKTNQALADALGEGFSPSYVSQLLSGHRGIGDEVADKIENRLGLTPGKLDDTESAPHTSEITDLVRTIETLTDSGKMSLEEIRKMTDMLKARG